MEASRTHNPRSPNNVSFDAVIVGAGPAGCAAAAALSGLGKRTLIIDSGVNRKKVLAGELLHPAGFSGLSELGFRHALQASGALTVTGFAVLEHERDPILLNYESLGTGITMEHHALVEALFEDIASRENVTVWGDARAEAVVSENSEEVVLKARRADGEYLVTAQMLVVATGRSGALRESLGITEKHEKVSTMVGLTVDSALLPHAGRGHVFVDDKALLLGYAIAPGIARILVDIAPGVEWKTLTNDPAWPAAVPETLRAAIREAMTTQKPIFASNDSRLPSAVVRRRIVLCGDAAGCCHPLSVNGMTSAVRDALALRDAVEESPNDLTAALRAYARERRGPQRTRIALASALYRCFAESTEEMKLLRRGMRRYWTSSNENQQASLALLSGRDMRMSAMAREYASVVTHALNDWARDAWGSRKVLGEIAPVGRLLGTVVPHATHAMIGAIDDTMLHVKGLGLLPQLPSRGNDTQAA